MIKRAATAIALVVATLQPAQACRGPQWESTTLLTELPAEAGQHDVVAQVEVIDFVELDRDVPPAATKVLVRVVKAIRGVQQGREFIVDTIGTSCDQNVPLNIDKVSWRPFIAGEFVKLEDRIVFRGPWRRRFPIGTFYSYSR